MPSTSLQDADKGLREKYITLRDEYQRLHPGHTLVITCTHRSPEEQLAAYAKGRSLRDGKWVVEDGSKIVTQLSGQPGQESRHNMKPARALDVAVAIGGKVTWDYREYLPIGPLAVKHGLEWGGHWQSFKDYPHLQLPKEAV